MKHVLCALTLVMAATLTGCNTTPTQDGAVLGGALGAGLGAIVGNQSGHAGEGALIGAGAGALTGALVGDRVDENRSKRYAAPAPAPAPVVQPSQPAQPVVRGHYETRIVRTASGETYEERVFVRDY
jgi:outer membrane lipoprotein SlyB